MCLYIHSYLCSYHKLLKGFFYSALFDVTASFFCVAFTCFLTSIYVYVRVCMWFVSPHQPIYETKESYFFLAVYTNAPGLLTNDDNNCVKKVKWVRKNAEEKLET